jgi:hypothetical protein
MRREYRGGAARAQLVSVLGNSTANLTISCNDLTNWPTGISGRPFYVVIDRNTASEEKILCTSRTSNTITVFDDGLSNGRGADGTSITTHAIGAYIEHVFTATDADEANAHVNNPVPHITVATSATRPAAPVANQTILQTDTATLFSYIDGAWEEVTSGGATGGGDNKVFFENDLTISEDYTVTTSKNAGTFGPVEVDSGVTVTIPSGSVWTVV